MSEQGRLSQLSHWNPSYPSGIPVIPVDSMPSQQVAPGLSVGLRSVLSAPSRDAELQRAGGEGDAASATGALIKIYIKKKKKVECGVY